MSTYQRKFRCIDPEEMYLYGDYNSEKARLIQLQLEICHDKPICKPRDEIIEFARGKYLVLLYNQINFDSNRYREHSIQPESNTVWIPVNT